MTIDGTIRCSYIHFLESSSSVNNTKSEHLKILEIDMTPYLSSLQHINSKSPSMIPKPRVNAFPSINPYPSRPSFMRFPMSYLPLPTHYLLHMLRDRGNRCSNFIPRLVPGWGFSNEFRDTGGAT
jgi:hypothetical protein